jgi:hypothetical protein
MKETFPMTHRPRGAGRHLAALHAQFLVILPRVELHGRIYFRFLSPDQKADLIQEMRALAWKWYLQLNERGKNPCEFMKAFTTLLARAVFCGRRLVGSLKAKHVMNPFTQRRHGFAVEPLPMSPRTSHEQLYALPNGQELHNAFEDRLRDNTTTLVPDQVQFRVDWPAWLATLSGRERRMIRVMAKNESTKDLARQFDLSPARISQKRCEFRDEWQRFCEGEDQQVVFA